MQEKILLYSIRVQKDEKAFERLISQHTVALRRFLAMRLPRHEDAEDAFSTILLRTWNYLKSSEVESVSGLIFTIARGVIAEFYRKKKFDTVPIEGHEDSLVNSEKELEVRIDVELLREQVSQMDDDQQLIFQLRFLDGLTIKEVAKRVQKSESATRMSAHRLLKKIRAEIQKKYDQPRAN
ncbi:MAG: RNA polymerase, sigma-24 subunit, ECF subfamily [Candidatus Uhrbacteria bacterium GW2011_GWE2_45_35]|uniref:RNA polymerase, sigma-24 subunit, ECF subfamily n=2 Tax=Candidatus Uhriibacteriota TaxID=1752732 RepID=A0A0G1JEP3_9BACT|nr:MAG: RNA polymerase, sigma-24 subunit, ECF subfamily [Candidatus Uhrbacteria bacterium GW2011_GWF2_44_350]KKU09161.1 MAG: RNA polymerase, sigma-24 subunit, ECF subfamily [Candidatus Uhrbacteria bacterium GW2011_GWE2_45_35]